MAGNRDAPAVTRFYRAFGRIADGLAGQRAWGDVGLYATQCVLSTLLAVRMLGFLDRPFSIPLVYSGDGLAGGSQIKGVLENGWYEKNPMLGAPHGQNMHDFPMADNLQFFLARLVGMFVKEWGAVDNILYLITFPLTALAATWFMRCIGCRPVVALFFGLLYAFTPYHFTRAQSHLALSFLFVVPLFAALVMKLLAGRPIWTSRPSVPRTNPLAWATWTNLQTLGIVALLGTTSSYYSVFGLILMTVAVVVLLLHREFSRLAEGIAAMGALVVVMLANMAPDILYTRAVGPSPAPFARNPEHSEYYAFKLTELILPAPWHRIAGLANYRIDYDKTFPFPSETPVLGVVAAFGFLYLLVVPFVATAWRTSDLNENGPFGVVQQRLALLTFVSFLFGTTGAFGTLFALWVSPDIRAWNRILVYIALFALASLALLTQAALERWDRRADSSLAAQSRLGRSRMLAAAVCGAIAVVGLYDGTPPRDSNADQTVIKAWYNDADYVAKIESRMPAEAKIYELPAMTFPESGTIESMTVYEPIRPYLHSTDLKWSYGAVKGRPASDWEHVLTGLPVPRMLTILGAAGFTGVHLDRSGYADDRPGPVKAQLTEMLGQPIVSRNKMFQFYDMRSFVAGLDHLYTPQELGAIRRHALEAPDFYAQGFQDPGAPDAQGRYGLTSSDPAPFLVIDNPGERVQLDLSFDLQVRGARRPTAVSVTWPDGTRQEVTVKAGMTVRLERSVNAPQGESRLSLRGKPGVTGIDLLQFQMTDPMLLGFELRLPAAPDAALGPSDASGYHAAERDDHALPGGGAALGVDLETAASRRLIISGEWQPCRP